MIRQGFGHIVNVASVAGLVPYPFALPYTASKHAVVGLSSALRAEAAAYGIDVSVVCPGAVRTAIWERSEVRGWDRARAQLDLERRIVRWMSADDCAQAILRGVAQRRGLIVVTAEARVATMLQRLSPAVAVRASQWVADRLRRSRRLAR
jgi:short-subunit dehydrogenase